MDLIKKVRGYLQKRYYKKGAKTKELTIAIVSGLCVAVPSVIATITANKKSSAITDFKIEELTKKVNIHNNLIDRMYHVETRVAVIEEELKDRK